MSRLSVDIGSPEALQFFSEFLETADRKLFDRLYPAILRFCLGQAFEILKDKDQALDAAQEVCFKLLDKGGKGGQVDFLVAYVKKAIRNHCFEQKRLKRNRVTVSLAENFEPLDVARLSHEIDKEIVRVMIENILADRPHLLNVVRDTWAALSDDEISVLRGRPKRLVYGDRSRAMKLIQARLPGFGYVFWPRKSSH